MPQPFLNVFQADTVCIEYFRFMSGSEDVERKNIPEPEFVPSVTYFTHDTGIMSASVARNFHYLLLMPEPERYFTVSLAAQQLGISQQEAEQILSEFYTRRLRQGRLNIPVSRHRAHSHAVRKRTGGYKTPPVGAIPTGGDPFLDTELPQMIFGQILQLATLHKFNNYFSLFQPNMLVFVAAFVPSLVSWRTFLAHKLKINAVF